MLLVLEGRCMLVSHRCCDGGIMRDGLRCLFTSDPFDKIVESRICRAPVNAKVRERGC